MAHDRFHEGDRLSGLQDVIVGTGGDRRRAMGQIRVGRENDHGARGFFRANAPNHVARIHVWQIEIEQHGTRLQLHQVVESVLPRVRGPRVEAVETQQCREAGRRIFAAFDDEHPASAQPP